MSDGKHSERMAPDGPGIKASWSPSAKDGVGTARQRESRVWFTLSRGILNEIYYPTLDTANTRDAQFIVTAPDGFFTGEEEDTDHELQMREPGIPLYDITNSCKRGRFRLKKTILAAPSRHVILQKVQLEVLDESGGELRLFALVNPNMNNHGDDNDAWSAENKGMPMLFASRNDDYLAFACSVGWTARSVGHVGVNDGWRILKEHGHLKEAYGKAHGNVALCAEIDPAAARDGVIVAIAFGEDEVEAGHHARAALAEPFERIEREYLTGWHQFQECCESLEWLSQYNENLFKTSRMVMRVHDSKQFPGGITASLSYPWGFEHENFEQGGYHLAWPRDLVETSLGHLALDDTDAALESLIYLIANQEEAGNWPQNMWLNGQPYWGGLQSDETAFVVVLAEILRRRDALQSLDPWPAIRRAISFMIQHGPGTHQDRWEENAGFSVFTLAAEVAALLAAASLAENAGEGDTAEYLRETADIWCDHIDRWTYVHDTPLARELDVDGYYVRLTPPNAPEFDDIADARIPISNRDGAEDFEVWKVVSPDALALVRFGLRDPNDPRIRNTIKAIDHTTREETERGPAWHRYWHDGYGETEDGEPFRGQGIGRCWPLLTGERAHYELMAGNREEAERLREVMESQAGDHGLFSEQIWDGKDIPEKCLWNGRPTGSACPLVWAHAEYLQLLRSLHEKQSFAWATLVGGRYCSEQPKGETPFCLWRPDVKSGTLQKGRKLRIELGQGATVRWSDDDWKTEQDLEAAERPMGMYTADLPVENLERDQEIVFTLRWKDSGDWEGEDYRVRVV